MPTVEEMVTRLTEAKKFTMVDVKDGFWQKCLDTESSFKTTFNTLFVWYRWKRMPFSIPPPLRSGNAQCTNSWKIWRVWT